MSEAVVTGSFHARQALEISDTALRDVSVRKFRERGGYNQFYARRTSETSLRIERLSISETSAKLEDMNQFTNKVTSYHMSSHPP